MIARDQILPVEAMRLFRVTGRDWLPNPVSVAYSIAGSSASRAHSKAHALGIVCRSVNICKPACILRVAILCAQSSLSLDLSQTISPESEVLIHVLHVRNGLETF